MTVRLKQGWFGAKPWAPVCADLPPIATPVGFACHYCGEAIEKDDDGIVNIQGYAFHYECNLRPVIGGLRHIQGRCFCCGGTEEPDPPELTKREAAVVAVMAWEKQIRGY